MMKELGTNPKDVLGLKKVPLRLVPPVALVECSAVMSLGARKYGAYNWRENKVRHSVYLEAAMRHLLQAMDGENRDSESGRPHEAHVLACMAILLDAKHTGNLIDDRNKSGRVAKAFEEVAALVGRPDAPLSEVGPSSLPKCQKCGEMPPDANGVLCSRCYRQTIHEGWEPAEASRKECAS